MGISHKVDIDSRPSQNEKEASCQPLFSFRHTPAAGLGAFSLCAIPKDTIILTIPGPYASVTMRKWKKEICAWCFEWRYAPVLAATSTLICEASIALQGELPTPLGRDKNSLFLPGIWYCGPSCQTSWTRDFELWEGEEGRWVANILEGFEKALGDMTRREREGRFAKKDRDDGKMSQADGNESISSKERRDVLEYLSKDMVDVDISAAGMTSEFLDQVWGDAQNLLESASTSKRRAKATTEGTTRDIHRIVSSMTISASSASSTLSLTDLDFDTDRSSAAGVRNSAAAGPKHDREFYKTRKKRPLPILRLNELELDIARFVLDGMIRKVLEDFRFTSESYSEGNSKASGPAPDPTELLRCVPQIAESSMSNPGLWKDFMLLQDNELQYIRSKPYMLVAGIKIFAFLKGVVSELSGQRRGQADEQKRRRASEMLSSDLETFNVVRAILSRDPGNVFGIWEEGDGEESEMFGWGAYVFGSFFNHDCTPNLKKRRIGRSVEFYTLKNVKEGDELSIAYVDVEGEDGDGEKRSTSLRDEWFFSCRCERCLRG